MGLPAAMTTKTTMTTKTRQAGGAWLSDLPTGAYAEEPRTGRGTRTRGTRTRTRTRTRGFCGGVVDRRRERIQPPPPRSATAPHSISSEDRIIRCSSTYLPHTHRPIDHHHHAVRPVSDSSPIRIHSKRPFEFEASFQDSASIHPSSAVLSSSIASIVYHLSTAWRVSRSAGNGPVARTSGGLIDSAS